MTSGQGNIPGNNEWTVPWQAPSGLDADELRTRLASMPEYDAAEDDIETFERDGVVLLEGAFADW